MDKNKKIDRKVESLFEHERSEMNLDHRWAKFEELLEEENRKPFFMFWCWGLLLLFIGILWGYNFYPNTTQKHVESKTDIDNYIELKKEVIEGNSTKKAIKEKNTDGSPFAILKNTKTAKRIAQIKNVNKNSIKTVKQDFKKES